MATFKKLEDIIAWQKARVFNQELKINFPDFIRLKEYDLMNQLKKSAGSSMDNIAEGFGRMGNAEFRNFLTIAHGSIMESISQLYRSFDFCVFDEERFQFLLKLAYEVERLTMALFNHLLQSEIRGVKYKPAN